MNEKVTIAKLSALKAIVVAVITMVGTLGAAYLTGFRIVESEKAAPDENRITTNNDHKDTECYLAISEFANVDVFCQEDEKVYGTFIYPNQGIESNATKCAYTGEKISGSNESIDFHFNRGKCDNGRRRAPADLECVSSPIGNTLTCELTHPGDESTASTIVYEQFKP